MVAGHNHMLSPHILDFSEELSDGIFLFGFKRDFDFKAGQVLGIALEENGPRRLYSICSGEQEAQVKILYNVIDEGYLTPRLSDLEAGDTLWITEPRGEFTDNQDPAIWIATGTGIAPFYSMLKSGLVQNKILIHGNRFLEQFHFFDEFETMLGKNYIRCCSAEEDEGVFFGRVTAFIEMEAELDPTLKYYLCGNAEMVVETRDILIQKGIPFDQIISEIYF
jgi:ferredoxin--NADP+ reductase